MPAFLRSLIRPPAGYSLGYIDYSAQEVAVAGALSGDEGMIDAYSSGDPHLSFAIQAGLAPSGASKQTHSRERELGKGCNFGVMYGMSAFGLSVRLGCSVAEAERLLTLHRRAYPQFWAWIENVVEYGFLRGRIHTVHGWQRHVTATTRRNQLLNFPMQATGADMLRLACCLLVDAGIEVLAPVHDAVLIQAPTYAIEDVVMRSRYEMERASRFVLSGLTVRTDSMVVTHPDRYVDGRGTRLWGRVSTSSRSFRRSMELGVRDRYTGGVRHRHGDVCVAVTSVYLLFYSFPSRG